MKNLKKTPGFKLAAYSSAAITSLMYLPAQGQIVYHDIDPDIAMDPDDTCIPDPPGYDYSPGGDFSCGETFTEFFDINFDGVVDFRMKVNHDYWSYWPSQYHTNRGSLLPYSLNRVGGLPDVVLGEVYRYVMGDLIGAGAEWNSAAHTVGYWNYENPGADHGEFAGTNYSFAAIRIKDGFGQHFGWIRLSVDPMVDVVTIHDFAYNATPGTSILAGESGDCYPPSITGVSNITPASAKLKWAPVMGATKYQLYYRESGVAGWTKLTLTAATIQKTITGLTCDTDYEWKMRTKCGAVLSDFSAIYSFTTGSCKIGNDNDNSDEILIYPNPSSENIIIDLSELQNGDDPIQIDIFDLTGRKIGAYLTRDDQFRINISEYVQGNYILKITSAYFTTTGQFIVQ
ncbi:MAG: T9SS type A sorting domain-containing protein [Chitinophagales bacterium]